MKMLKGYIAGESLQTTYIAGLDEWNIRSSSWPINLLSLQVIIWLWYKH